MSSLQIISVILVCVSNVILLLAAIHREKKFDFYKELIARQDIMLRRRLTNPDLIPPLSFLFPDLITQNEYEKFYDQYQKQIADGILK